MFKKYDKENMFESIWNFPNNLKDAIALGNKLDLRNDYSDVKNIVIAGMGGYWWRYCFCFREYKYQNTICSLSRLFYS